MLKNGFYAVFAQLLMVLSKFGIYILISRFVGPHGQGIFALGITTSTVLALLFSMGIENSNAYFSGKNSNVQSELFTNSFLITLGVTGLLFLLLYPFSMLVRPYFLASMSLFDLCSMIMMTAGHLIFHLFINILAGMKLFKIFFIAFACRYLTALGIVAVCVYYFLPISNLFVAWALSTFLADIYCASYLYFKVKVKIRLSKTTLKKQISYGIKSYVERLSNMLTYRLDLFILGLFRGASVAGFYSIATSFAEIFLNFPRALARPVLVEKANEAYKDSVDVSFYYKIVFLLNGLAVVVMGICGELFVTYLFSADFKTSVLPMRILLVGAFCMSIGIIANSHLLGLGYPSKSAKAGSVALAITFILDVVLIPKWGIVGAACASSVAYSSYALVALFYVKKLQGISLRNLTTYVIPTIGDAKVAANVTKKYIRISVKMKS